MTPRPWPRWLGIVAIAVAALVLRLFYLAELRDTPLFAVLIGDGQQYDAWARRIAAGQWLGTDIFYQTPLYPYLLAVVFSIAGHSLMAVRLLQALLGTASCVLLALAGRRFVGNRAGLVAGMLLAIYPPAIFFDGLIQKSSLDLFLVTLLLALLGEFMQKPRWPWLVGAGAALGAFTLNRENARVLYPIVLGWLWLGFRAVPARTRVLWATVFTLAAAAVVVPVGFRNAYVGGEFLISTSQFGPNLYIGNHAGARGSYEPLVPGHANAAYERVDATRLAEAAAGRTLSPGEVSDYWVARTIGDIRRAPGAWLVLLGRKLLLTFNAREIVDTESLEAYADYSGMLRGLGWINFGTILPLCALGVCLWRVQDHRPWLIAASIIGIALSVAVFYVFARYRYPMVPFVLLFAGGGVSGLLAPDIRRSRPVAAGLVAAVAVALMAHVTIPAGRDATYMNVGSELVRAGRAADAVPLLEKNVAALSDHAPAHFFLGVALKQAGETTRAVDEFAAAIRLAPDDYDAHAAMGAALQERGDPTGALQHFAEAVRLRPDSVEAHWNLGLARQMTGDHDGAIAQYREVLRLGKETFAVRMGLGTALSDAGRPEEAVEHFTRAAALLPESVPALCSLAQAYGRLGRLHEAEASLEKALALAAATGKREMIPEIETALRACRTQTTARIR